MQKNRKSDYPKTINYQNFAYFITSKANMANLKLISAAFLIVTQLITTSTGQGFSDGYSNQFAAQPIQICSLGRLVMELSQSIQQQNGFYQPNTFYPQNDPYQVSYYQSQPEVSATAVAETSTINQGPYYQGSYFNGPEFTPAYYQESPSYYGQQPYYQDSQAYYNAPQFQQPFYPEGYGSQF